MLGTSQHQTVVGLQSASLLGALADEAWYRLSPVHHPGTHLADSSSQSPAGGSTQGTPQKKSREESMSTSAPISKYLPRHYTAVLNVTEQSEELLQGQQIYWVPGTQVLESGTCSTVLCQVLQ